VVALCPPFLTKLFWTCRSVRSPSSRAPPPLATLVQSFGHELLLRTPSCAFETYPRRRQRRYPPFLVRRPTGRYPGIPRRHPGRRGTQRRFLGQLPRCKFLSIPLDKLLLKPDLACLSDGLLYFYPSWGSVTYMFDLAPFEQSCGTCP